MPRRPRMWKGSGVYPDAAGDPELPTSEDGGAGRERRWRRGGGGKEIPSIADLGEAGRWLVGLNGEDIFEFSPLVAWPSIFLLVYYFVMKRMLVSVQISNLVYRFRRYLVLLFECIKQSGSEREDRNYLCKKEK